MEIDWEVEIGGGAPVIEADWPGFTNLRENPERIGEITEASAFPPLADLLLRLNSHTSPVWTPKCDVWQPEDGGLACYVDLIPRAESLFADWRRVEWFCRALVEQMTAHPAPGAEAQAGEHRIGIAQPESEGVATISFVVRQAITGRAEGYGITAYFSAGAESLPDVATVVADAMVAFSSAIRSTEFLEAPDKS
jgi:hypothetical protein